MSSRGLDYTLLTFVLIGAINWGLIGISGLYLLSAYGRIRAVNEA